MNRILNPNRMPFGATLLVAAGALASLALVLWDTQLTTSIVSLSGRLPLIDSGVVLIAKWLVVILGGLWLCYSATKKDWFGSIAETGLALGVAFLASQSLQTFWHRKAPFVLLELNPLVHHAPDGSFPSDHATVAFVIATSLFLLHRPVGHLAFLMAACIGVARVYCSLHWMSDVLGGALLGVLARLLVAKSFPAKVIEQPDRGMLFLTNMARAFACLWLFYYYRVYPPGIQNSLFGIARNELFVPVWLAYIGVAVWLWLASRRCPQWSVSNASGPIPNQVTIRQWRRHVWLQVFADALFVTAFYVLTLDVQSAVFLLFLIPLFSGLASSDFTNCLQVFVLTTTCFLLGMVIIIYQTQWLGGTGPGVDIPFLAGTAFLPRVVCLFALMVAFGWQIKHEEKYRAAVRTLSESAAVLSSLVDNVPLNIYRIDKDRRLTFVNKQYCETLSKTSDEVKGKQAADLFPPDLAKIYDADDDKVLNKDLVVSKEETNEPPGKPRTVVHVIKTPIRSPSGEVIGLQGVFWDVTAEKAAQDRLTLKHEELNFHLAENMERLRSNELRYRVIFEHASDIIYTHDLKGQFTSLNKAGEQLTGYSRPEFLKLTVSDIVVPEHHERARQKTAEKLARIPDQDLTTIYELEIQTKCGTRIPLEINSTVILQHGQPFEIQGVARVITERKARESEAARKLRIWEMLLKEVHHRIHNNLNAITARLNEIDANLDRPEIDRKALKDIARKCRARFIAMDSLHRQLYMSANQSTVDMDEYLTILISHLSCAYESRPVLVTAKVAAGPIRLNIGTANVCGLIATELVSNAIEHAFPLGQPGDISVELTRESGRGFALLVSDSGVGMKSDEIERSRSGLALVRDLVEWFGGTVGLLPGSGTTIRVRFQELKYDETKG